MQLILLAVAALAYLFAGFYLLNRGLNYARNRALTDEQFFQMAVTDERSTSMTLAKSAFVLFWLPLIAAYLAVLAVSVLLRPKGQAFA